MVIIVLLKSVTRLMLSASLSTLLCRGDVLQSIYSVDLFCGCCCFAFLQEALVTFNMSEGQHSNLHQLPADSCESRMAIIETRVKLIERLFALPRALFFLDWLIIVMITFTTAVFNAKG